MILPEIEQQAVYDGYWTLPLAGYRMSYPGPNAVLGDDPRLRQSRMTKISTFYCPGDISPVGNELYTAEFGFYRGNYRGCVGSGDMYGNAVDPTLGPWGVGVFGVKSGQSFDKTPNRLGTKPNDITDGLSRTLLLSEGLVASVTTGWGGPMGETIDGNMGGTLFSASLTPNSALPDRVIGPCPQDLGDGEYQAPCLSIGAMTVVGARRGGRLCRREEPTFKRRQCRHGRRLGWLRQ